jgi:hypothetical protein
MALSTRDRRALVVVGVVLVVAAAAFFLLTNGGGGHAAAPKNPGRPNTAPSTAPSPAQHPKKTKVGRLLVFSGRDPFLAQGSLAVAASPSPDPLVSPPGTPPPAAPDGSSKTIDGHTILLDDVFASGSTMKAQVEVDGKIYTVSEGETFAGNFTFVSGAGHCADFRYGDQSFSLCVTGHK